MLLALWSENEDATKVCQVFCLDLADSVSVREVCSFPSPSGRLREVLSEYPTPLRAISSLDDEELDLLAR